MENKKLSTDWMHAYKIICYVYGSFYILAVFSLLFLNIFISMASHNLVMSEETFFIKDFSVMFEKLNLYCVVVYILYACLFFLIAYGISKRKKIGLVGVYVQPIFTFIIYVVAIFYFNNFSGELISILSLLDVDYRTISILTSFSKYFIYFFSITAIIVESVLFTLNIIYFHKRRELFN